LYRTGAASQTGHAALFALNTTMLDRGKLAVLLMLAVAVAAAGFAWWWNIERTKRSLALYGAEGAWLVRNGREVEILKLAPFGSDDSTMENAPDSAPEINSEPLTLGDFTFAVADRYDVSRVKGLVHARSALVDDPSYDWDAPPQQLQGETIPWLVRFADERGEIYLAIDPEERQLAVLPAGQRVRLIPKIAAGWQSFLERHTAPAGPRETQATTPPAPIRTVPSE
jgi:hypothetical protein